MSLSERAGSWQMRISRSRFVSSKLIRKSLIFNNLCLLYCNPRAKDKAFGMGPRGLRVLNYSAA
jgi:hypothetical protein